MARAHFITREVTEKVIAACPDVEWRLIVALSRYGGLRCPSETQALRWGDIDWDNNRINVPSPKTEHLAGGAFRTIPLFKELRPILEEAFDLAEPGSCYVIDRYRGDNQNLRTQFERILRRAGVRAWERLFHNLRASRETELTSEHPLHVVCSWIGNSAIIAAKHYLQATDDHFAKATGVKTEGVVSQEEKEGGAKCGAVGSDSEARNAALHPVARERRQAQNTKKARKSGLKCNLVRRQAILYKRTEYPVGESNPCLRRERALSWATRRTGRKWRESRIFRHAGPLVNWSPAAAFTT